LPLNVRRNHHWSKAARSENPCVIDAHVSLTPPGTRRTIDRILFIFWKNPAEAAFLN
jgi:hypothetical protein